MSQQAIVNEQKAGKVHRYFLHPIIALVLISLWSVSGPAQMAHIISGSAGQGANLQQKNDANGFIQVVREATEKYKDVSVSVADGYTLQFGCVSGPQQGAMGLHFVNGALVASGEPANPAGLLSKSSYVNFALSKEGGRADKYAGEACSIVRPSAQASRQSLALDRTNSSLRR